MTDLIHNLLLLLIASWNVIVSLLGLLLPWTPLMAWVAFWLLAVDWVKLRTVLVQGGWIGVLFLGLMMILVWGMVAPPDKGSHFLFGLHVSNFVGKTVYVTALLTIMFLCGSVQLSGACGSLAYFPEDAADDHGHDSHGGHGGHGDHGHGDHGHGDHGHSEHGHGHVDTQGHGSGH